MAYERKDRYYRKAKEQGLPSRASFKIEEIIQKYHFVRPGNFVLDLGAAPGGWAVLLAKAVGPQGKVFALDLESLAKPPPANVSFFQGDIREEKTSTWLKEQLAGKKLDAVCSDMSPKLSGIFFKDAYISTELAELALEMARFWLKPGGHFVAKLFPGEEFPAYLKKVRAAFTSVKVVEPEASRKTSREVYVLGLKRTGQERNLEGSLPFIFAKS
ncbi:MAG TPA: 23S rRNA methyltransferase [Deltaproteobacteria bacterium]|nr:23S rRNA methyltransferase [Deltaproteobacteria bacterium]